MEKLISIIVPIFNVQEYLEKCVNSLINQTYKNLEIILVDDGSTDNSPLICDKFATTDERIKVIHKKNGGLSDARNTGIKVASGDYYSFIDSDDYIKKDTIEVLCRNLQETKSDIAICNMIQFYETGETKAFYKPTDKRMVFDGLERFETLKQPSVCNKLFKAELFENISFPYGKYYEDTYVYHEILYKTEKVVMTGQDGYWYFIRKGSILNQKKYDSKYFDLIEAVWLRTKFLMEHNIQPYGYEACLSLYAAISNMEKNMSKKEYNEEIASARLKYEYAYKSLMNKKANINLKQKIRLILLKYFPKIHSIIY